MIYGLKNAQRRAKTRSKNLDRATNWLIIYFFAISIAIGIIAIKVCL